MSTEARKIHDRLDELSRILAALRESVERLEQDDTADERELAVAR